MLDAIVQSSSLLSTLLTPFILLAALFFALRFLRMYERTQLATREELAVARAVAEVGAPHTAQTNITIAGDPTATGGYDFVQVPDDFKPLFLDAMNGFCDYARLRGYSVELSTEASHPGKVGIKFTIVDIGVTVSTATVRRDVDEYLRKFKDGDDLRDMPMPENAVEHVRIVSALEARWASVKHQLEVYQIRNDFLERLLKLKGSGLSGIGYHQVPQTQTIHLTLQNDGASNMGDTYKATNSQNIAQGRGASATTTNSNIQIGSNHTERQERIDRLKEFVQLTRTSDLPDQAKADVTRYIENAKDEMETSSSPDADQVGKWLGRAETTISAANGGADLLAKLAPLLVLFGLS